MNRILVLHPSDELYGADRVLLDVVPVLGRRAPVTVWIADDVEYQGRPLTHRLEELGVRVEARPLPVVRRAYLGARFFPRILRRMWRTWSHLRRSDADLVYLNTTAMLLVAPIARLLGIRVVVHVHETWGRLERLALGPLLALCDTVIAVSDAAARGLTRRARVQVVHNATSVVPRLSDERRQEMRALLGLGASEVLVACVGRWNHVKGHAVLLEAWGALEREDMHLVIIGGPPPSGHAVDVLSLVAASPRAATIHVLGERLDAVEWIEAADLLALPSVRPDSFPLTALEAGAVGTPSFASNIGGLPEIVHDGLTGRLLPAGEVEAWREGLETVRRAELASWGKEARRQHDELFLPRRFARALTRALVGGAR